MTNPKRPGDLSEQELRRLLLDKRQRARQKRLERFRRTGRAISLSPDPKPAALDKWRSQPPVVLPEEDPVKIARRRLRRLWFDRILLVIEILAVVGLIGLVLNWFGLLQTLNQEVAAAMHLETSTPTATPLTAVLILPGGHAPPQAISQAQPVVDEGSLGEEILQEATATPEPDFTSLPTPTPASTQAIRIRIPAISVDAPVVQGDGWEELMYGVGQHPGSADPGQVGNVVLSAHDDIYGEFFRYLDRLLPGDQVSLFTEQQEFVYIVTGVQVIEPTRVDVMNPTSDPTLTLISCYPYLVDTQRIVVFAKLQNLSGE